MIEACYKIILCVDLTIKTNFNVWNREDCDSDILLLGWGQAGTKWKLWKKWGCCEDPLPDSFPPPMRLLMGLQG